ncbi:Zinc finger domain-containing protein, GATA-type [Cordyceps militaris CM01]|uniref:Zinc finger domain-containing protein, GATA-type n=1 Tax=Cordyceps militaris (strain CM01) TaxID=983644 RepID=G3J672_CORMM|nr:Zinc finger domain-containing protein, GATA-type [Cordyceps militaris CM01]EGX96971.1 Zinc finger domain-containing protein, GATA-type [Cordyceps militaris CM01]
MPRQGEDRPPQGSAPGPIEPLEQYTDRRPVSRLKVGETLQTIRRTAQDLCRFQDNVGGRSALVHDSNPNEAQNGDGRHIRGSTKPPGDASRAGNNPSGSDHIRLHQRRPPRVPSQGVGCPAQYQHFRKHLRTDISCHQCGESSTPEWRHGPHGPKTLCNVCGLIYAKQESHRRRDKSKSENPRKTRAR